MTLPPAFKWVIQRNLGVLVYADTHAAIMEEGGKARITIHFHDLLSVCLYSFLFSVIFHLCIVAFGLQTCVSFFMKNSLKLISNEHHKQQCQIGSLKHFVLLQFLQLNSYDCLRYHMSKCQEACQNRYHTINEIWYFVFLSSLDTIDPEERDIEVKQADLKKHLTITEVDGKPRWVCLWSGT